jgi:glyoxylase-like metal-dependent hydrolase (beta-lactamase superfamily II)
MSLTLGEITITRVVEMEGPFTEPHLLLPAASPEGMAAHHHWLAPQFVAEDGKLIMSIQTYVIQTRHHTVLVDTCVGNHKQRTIFPDWNMMDGPYLQNLAALGVSPEQVDYVLCTHLHVDHVGWNTQLKDGKWVPTFPNAKYLFAQKEWEFWKSEYESGGDHAADDGSIADSVLPIVEAGKAELVAGDHSIDDEMHLEPSPGHTPGHVCLHLTSGGKRAIMTGDMMHHPVQCSEPQWSSGFCVDPKASALTRRQFLETYCDQDVIVLAAHFLAPTGGRIVPNGNTWKFQV